MNKGLILAFMNAVVNMLLTIMHNTCPKDERFAYSMKAVDQFLALYEGDK